MVNALGITRDFFADYPGGVSVALRAAYAADLTGFEKLDIERTRAGSIVRADRGCRARAGDAIGRCGGHGTHAAALITVTSSVPLSGSHTSPERPKICRIAVPSRREERGVFKGHECILPLAVWAPAGAEWPKLNTVVPSAPALGRNSRRVIG